MVYPTSLDTPMRTNSLIQSHSEGEDKRREDPNKCALMIIDAMQKGSESVYMPTKGKIGVILQPLFPRLIRWKLIRSSKL